MVVICDGIHENVEHLRGSTSPMTSAYSSGCAYALDPPDFRGFRVHHRRQPEQTLKATGRRHITDQIRFDDGAAYERYMGTWSQLVGEAFLDWLGPTSGLRWLDVGCGNGAFTERLIERCGPAAVDGVDPSGEQLAYARTRPAGRLAQFHQGDAMALPFPDGVFDVTVMPLVIFFVPDPPRGVAEMVRVVRPGGTVAAYAWDMPGGGFPYAALQEEMRGLGLPVPSPPSAEASRIDVLRELWVDAGLETVDTQEITVQRTFLDFEDYWVTVRGGPSVGRQLTAMAPPDAARLKALMAARLPADASGRITCRARANAVKGVVPAT